MTRCFGFLTPPEVRVSLNMASGLFLDLFVRGMAEIRVCLSELRIADVIPGTVAQKRGQ